LDSSKPWLGVGLHRYCFCLDTVIHLLGGKPVDISSLKYWNLNHGLSIWFRCHAS